MSTGVPTIFGVVTTENIEQAVERAGQKQVIKVAMQLWQLWKWQAIKENKIIF